jgi:hypothetical protein
VKVTTVLIGLVVILAAFVISWTAEGATPKRRYWQLPFTELESVAQDFQAHLATTAELQTVPVNVPVSYPPRTAPGVTGTMHNGFSQQWRPVASLPHPSTDPW